MRVKLTIALIFFISVIGISLKPIYSADIEGNIKLGEGWQPIIYMASINAPENLNVASPDFIVSKTIIGADGSFEFDVITLPADPQFYRFYLVKNVNSLVEFNLTGDKNFVHFILDNSTNLSFSAEIVSNSLKIINVQGEDSNLKLLEFEKNYSIKKNKLSGDLSKAQKEFLTLDIENYIRSYVDSCESSMVGLYALYYMDDKETDFLRNSEFYFDFQKRLNKEFPNNPYSESYGELLEDLVGFRDIVCEIPGVVPKWKNQLLIAQGIFILLLIVVLIRLIRKQRSLQRTTNSANESQVIFENLTSKEKEILQLLSAGKTNKEIAIELFIELSTVKTHINNIYKQLKVGSRKEATSYFNSINNSSSRGV